MNRLDIAVLVGIIVVLVIGGGYAAYSGTIGNNQPQVQAAGENCTGINCTQDQNCTGINCVNKENKNCTGNCTADGNKKQQRKGNCPNK